MPKAFTAIEKEHIRNRLKEKGTELFIKYGIKRTTVDDLVKLSGISKGSFFSFFSNKEELFFTVFTENYIKLNDEFKKQLYDSEVPLKTAFTSYLINRFTIKKNPLLSVFYNHENFEYLNRKISQEKLSEFITNDFNDLISIITNAQKKHKIIEYEPRRIVEIFHALFYISVMKQDMQRFNQYEQDITEFFIEIIVNYFIPQLIKILDMEKSDNFQFMDNILSVRQRIQITALGLFILCVSWIVFGVLSMSPVKAEWTNSDYLHWVSKPSLSFTLTYINATLLTIIDLVLFYFLYSYLYLFNKTLAQLGLIFIPIYGVLNIVCYSIQITTVPSIANIALESGNIDFAIQLVQAKNDTLIGYLNGLAYTILGIPSIIYGYILVKQRIKFSGLFLIASAIFDFFGITGYFIGNKTLAIGMILGGVAFTIALICIVIEFKKLKK